MTLLYLIRHGATRQNQARPVVLQGNGTDGPLSETGQTQAAGVARVLSQKGLSSVYASPMRRAQETAAVIAKPHGLSVRTVAELHEVDVGAWEGRSWSQIMQEEPDEYARFIADPGRIPYRSGESYADVLNRVKPAVTALCGKHQGESIAIIAHNVVNRVLIADVLDLPMSQAREIRQANCCVNVLRYKDERLQLVTLNAELELFGLPTGASGQN